MKFAVIVIAAILFGAIAGHYLMEDSGYVAISFHGYLIEMSVVGFIVVAALTIFAAWVALRVYQAPRRIGEAAGRYRSARSGQKLTQGMIEVAEGNFARGEKLLARAARTSDAPLFNYLQAARAAHLQGQDNRRDEWLKLAYEQTPEAANAVLLTQAELQLDRQQYEQALATLRRIEENSRDHSYALALLGRLYYRLRDWDQLAKILPRIQKHKRIKQETVDRWQKRVHCERFNKAPDGAAVLQEWQAVDKQLRKDIEVLEAYYLNLIRTGQNEKAEKDLVAALKTEWRGPLVRLYGLVEGPDVTRQLRRAENWLATHGDDPDLLLAAARLCLRNELWGKARSYLETVIGLHPAPEAYQEYGRLLDQLGETDAAAGAFRDGLNMVSPGSSPDIPRLGTDKR